MKLKTSQIERLWLWFFPRRCVWCMGVTEPEHMLCADCQTMQAQRFAPELMQCSQIPLVCVFTYHSRARRILLNVKFHGGRKNIHSIGFAMADALREAALADETWLFCAVPMTQRQLKIRAFNQSELLAKTAARWFDAPYAQLLRKTRETQTQHDLPAPERAGNVANAYAVAQPGLVKNKKIVLCDDICTTGATMQECARALQDAGAQQVICLCYLRTELMEGRDAHTGPSNRD